MCTVYIYALTDAITQEVYYVGQTIHPQQRLSQHTNMWFNRNKGKQPGMIILETTALKDAYERERFWIAKYANEGARLANENCNPEYLARKHAAYEQAKRNGDKMWSVPERADKAE